MKNKLRSIPREQIEKKFGSTLNILFIVEALFAAFIYALLRNCISINCADIFIFCAYIFTLKQSVDAQESNMKQKFLDEIYGPEDKQNEDKEYEKPSANDEAIEKQNN